jgi:MFS family permease
MVALLALCAGSIIGAVAPTIAWMIGGRVVQGVGGGVLPLAFGIARDEFPERVATVVGLIAALTSVGFGMGFILGGPLSQALGLEWLFWMPATTTGLAALAALLVPRVPTRPGDRRLPILPAAALSLWLVGLLVLLSEGATWGWTSPQALAIVAVLPVAIAVWIWLELRAPVPMVDLRMMRVRGVWTANLVAAFIGFGMFGCFGFLPQLIQTPPEAGYGLGSTVTEAGRILVPWAVCSSMAGASSAALARRVGYRNVVVAGSLIGSIALASIATFHDHAWQLSAATASQGVGAGLVFASLTAVVVVSVDGEVTSVASAMNVNVRTLGGCVGSALMAGIVSAHAAPGGYPAEVGYVRGFQLLSASMLVAAIAGVWIPRLRPRATRERVTRDRGARRPRVAWSPRRAPIAATYAAVAQAESADNEVLDLGGDATKRA